MARTKLTARKSTGGMPPRMDRPRNSVEPMSQDAKEVSKASIVLRMDGVGDFIKKAGNTKTSASVSAGGIQWQLRVETSAADDGGKVQLGCSLQSVHVNGAWSRWLTADVFVWDHSQHWHKLGSVREKLVGSAPLSCSAGESRLVSAQKMRGGRYSFICDDSARFCVNFACWKDSFQTKGDFDDVTFVVEGRPVYANKGYISPMLRAMLTGNFMEGQSDQVPIKQTSAEDFVTFMRAVAPFRDPVSDANVQTLYGLADVYDAGFLRRDCEKHLIATEGIKAIDKLLLAQSLNKTDFIARLVDCLRRADLKKIQNDARKDELSEEA